MNEWITLVNVNTRKQLSCFIWVKKDKEAIIILFKYSMDWVLQPPLNNIIGITG